MRSNSPSPISTNIVAKQCDSAGNQTLIQTGTGIWNVTYNAEHRPTRWTQGSTVITCSYDYLGRMGSRQVTANGTTTSHEHYLYRDYLRIATLDMTSNKAHRASILWDPRYPVSTQPLAIKQGADISYYHHDFNKNVTELSNSKGQLTTTYDYSPYGEVTTGGSTLTPHNPLQWSSEIHDPALSLTYYNYRHYNPADGRWISRDPIEEEGGVNLYGFVGNRTSSMIDLRGLSDPWYGSYEWGGGIANRQDHAKTPPNSWTLGVEDLFRWIGGVTPSSNNFYDPSAITYVNSSGDVQTDYPKESDRTKFMRQSPLVNELRKGLKNKFKDKCCRQWCDGYTNVALNFGAGAFIGSILNGVAHFVGSARGDVSFVGLRNNIVIMRITITNTTSMQSAFYHITSYLNRRGPNKMGTNWIQTYTWEEMFIVPECFLGGCKTCFPSSKSTQ